VPWLLGRRRPRLPAQIGSWKSIFGQKGGGYGGTVPDAPAGQLDDLATDPGEMNNRWMDKSELVAELTPQWSASSPRIRTTCP